MAAALYIDLTHTAKWARLTGIQRVAIEYLRALKGLAGAAVVPVIHGARGFEALSAKEEAELLTRHTHTLSQDRKKGWSWSFFKKPAPLSIPGGSVLFVPEIFRSDLVGSLDAFSYKVAFFHDASVLRHPSWATAKTLQRFPVYMEQLLRFDLILAPSHASARELQRYFAFLGVMQAPSIMVIEHGQTLPLAPVANEPTLPPHLLVLGTLEARKNHLNLFAACEKLWAAGHKFSVEVVGATASSGQPAAERLAAMQKAGLNISYRGALSDVSLEPLWTSAWGLVYPSLDEGYGLPVAEALTRGVPVLCGNGGALLERTAKGGCEVALAPTAEGLALALERFLDATEREKLAAQARSITPRLWSDAAKEFLVVLSEAGYSIL